MIFEVNMPDGTTEIRELIAVDCKSQDCTRDLLHNLDLSGIAEYNEEDDYYKADARQMEWLEECVNKYNEFERNKKTVFDEILKEKGPEEAAKAEQAFYAAFLPGGEYENERTPQAMKKLLEAIREQHLPGRQSEELNAKENSTVHYPAPRYYLEADAKAINVIKEVLNMPKKDGGLGFQYDEERKQWYTTDEKDLEMAHKLMGKVQEKEREQGRPLDLKTIAGTLRDIEKEVAHEM